MKWKEFKSTITEGYCRKYTPTIKFTETGLANINTIFSKDKRVVDKKYYQLYVSGGRIKKIAIKFTNKKTRNCGRLSVWNDHGKRFRFLNKKFADKLNLAGAQVEFEWDASEKMFVEKKRQNK